MRAGPPEAPRSPGPPVSRLASGLAPMARVTLDRVSKQYGDVPAVRDVSLTVEEGTFVSLLGPSGSGKTTLLRLIAGFLAPDQGDIWLGDRRVNAVPPHRRNIGMVFQQYALFPHLTVFDNVGFGLDMRGIARTEAATRIRETLALVKLEGLEHRYPRELSGGQQQRVALGRSIAIKPALLLLDEPLSALDRKLRAEMQIELRQLQQVLGITTLYVTHDQEEALTLSDRIAILQDGVVAQVGTPREVYERPASVFVAGFMGTANVFEGIVEAEGAGLHVRSGSLALPIPSAGGPEPGSTIRVAVRPERVRVERSAPAGAPAIPGQVVSAVYLGAATHYHVEVAGRHRVLATTPNAREVGPVPERGDTVYLSWRVEDVLVLKS